MSYVGTEPVSYGEGAAGAGVGAGGVKACPGGGGEGAGQEPGRPVDSSVMIGSSSVMGMRSASGTSPDGVPDGEPGAAP